MASSNKDVGNSDTSNASPINCGIVKQRCWEFGHVKDKDFSRITQSTAVPARGSAAAPIGSPLSVQGPSPSRNFGHPACPGSTCLSELKRAYEILVQCIEKQGDELTFLKRRYTHDSDGGLTLQTHEKQSAQQCALLGMNPRKQSKKNPHMPTWTRRTRADLFSIS